jgi:class 3 adenylate cyclase
VVISHAVFENLATGTDARELDTIRVKGKKKSVRVYELLALPNVNEG